MSWVDSGHPLHGREDKPLGSVGREIWEGSEDDRAQDLSVGVPEQNLPERPVHLVDETFEEGMKARIDVLLARYIQTVHP